MAADGTFKRNQVDQALWDRATYLRDAGARPPKVFLTRIKRLLELDRDDRWEIGAFAFSAGGPAGRGVDLPFTAFDTFMLALGLDLLELGFKQSEIVFLLKHIRGDLAPEFEWIMDDPPPLRQRARPKDHPTRPSYKSPKGIEIADFRVYVLIQRVEIKEAYPMLATKGPIRQPIFLTPTLCRGVDELRAEMLKSNIGYRNYVVLELSETARLVSDFLDKAPARRRGPG